MPTMPGKTARKTSVMVLCALALVSCAPHASEISPAPVSAARYEEWRCGKLQKEQTFVEESLTRVSADQDRAANQDALMVFLIGVPTSGGGVKGQVADLKGQLDALHAARRDQNCL